MQKMPRAFVLAAIASFGWLLSGAVHEAGHAIVAKMAGLRIVEIAPWGLWRAHVRLAGDTTRSWYAAIHVSGMLLTVIVGIVGVVATSLAGKNRLAGRYAVWLFVPMMCQCLAWLALPLAIAMGAIAPKDDVAKFLQQTGWSPLAVALVGFVLVGLCAAVLWWTFKRGRVRRGIDTTGNTERTETGR